MSERLSPLGIGCTLQRLRDGRYFVSPQNGFQRGNAPTQQPGYTGEGPFSVHERADRDIVECVPIERTREQPEWDPPTTPVRYFYFALRASWTYSDSSDPSADFSSDTNYPMFESAITTAVNGWQGFVGKKGPAVNPPPLSFNPYKRDFSPFSIDETSNVQEFGTVASGISTYTLNALWFYRGALTPGGGNEIGDGKGLGTATPAHAGAVLTGGLWDVLWDVYTFDGTDYTFVETKTYGPFSVPSDADPADHTSWASVSPSDAWALELGVDVGVVFRNLRIERVLS